MPGHFQNKSFIQGLLAFLVFVVSSTIAAGAYARLLEQEKPGDSKLLSLKSGEQSFNITSHGRCVGTLHTNLEQGKGSFCTVNGSLNSLWQNKLVSSQLKASFYFNPLGQLNYGEISLQVDTNEVTLNLNEVNPIKLNIKGLVAGKNFEHALALPGPLTLIKSSTDNFTLQRKSLHQLPNGASLPILENLRTELALEVKPAEASQPTCTADNLEPLDLAPIAALATQIYTQSPIK